MKKEAFRMINVISNSNNLSNLDDMNLHIHHGEIVGLVPINGIGVEMFLDMISGPAPIQFGKVYINNLPLDNRHPNKQLLNKIYILNQQHKLVDSLSVLENIYVLNRLPFLGFIRRKPLLRQYAWLTEELSFHAAPEILCERLSEYDRCIVEILKAINQGSQLIVLYGINDILSGVQLENFKEMLPVLSKKGYSFLYICSRYEESLDFCDRVIYMKDGQDIQSFDRHELHSIRYMKFIQHLLPPETFTKHSASDTILNIRHFQTNICAEFSFHIHQGECLVIYDETKELQKEFLDYMRSNHGALHDLYDIKSAQTQENLEKSIGHQLAVIGENPLASMLFYDMSYIENLCMRMESKLKRIHVSNAVKESVQKEYHSFIGDDIYAESIENLNAYSLYNLIYYRIALLNPQAVFIIQPFYNTDIYLKKHIRELIYMLQEQKIAVIILSADMLDSTSIANRRLILENGILHE